MIKLPIKYSKSSPKIRKMARNKYIRVQGGYCWFCHKHLEGEPSETVLSKPINMKLFPPSMFKYSVHLHHNHKTDLTIGAVHSRCNAHLWQYRGE